MEFNKQQAFHIAKMFDSIAHRYDFLNHFLSLGIDHFWRKKAIRQLKLNQNSLVLDIATGTGDMAYLAIKQGAKLVFGIDPAKNMLINSKDKFINFDYKYVRIQAFAEELPFKDQYFSHTLIAFGIRNCSERKKAFQEIYRTLKENGTFLILEFSQIKNPIIAKIFHIYFNKLLPLLGGFISGNREAYRYLPESVSGFISPEKLSQEACTVGFELKQITPLFFGLCTIYVFKKNSRTFSLHS